MWLRSDSLIFSDEKKLSPEYVPKGIPCREQQFMELLFYFRETLASPQRNSQHVFITGPVGSGKTLLSEKLREKLEEMAQRELCDVLFYRANCRINRTLSSVLTAALSKMGRVFPPRGYSKYEILNFFVEVLKSEDKHIILVFDEIDSLVLYEGLEPLYMLARLKEVTGQRQYLSTIFISKDLNYLHRAGQDLLSILKKNFIKLEKYAREQLKVILEYRAELAFKPGVVDKEAIDLAAEISSYFGDARQAIELLYMAGKIAENRENRRVSVEHVRLARDMLPPQLRREELEYLEQHEKLILLAIASIFSESERECITMGELEREYGHICSKFGVRPHSHTRLWEKVKLLEAKGFIASRISGSGFKGKTTLISLISLPAERLLKELEGALPWEQ